MNVEKLIPWENFLSKPIECLAINANKTKNVIFGPVKLKNVKDINLFSYPDCSRPTV